MTAYPPSADRIVLLLDVAALHAEQKAYSRWENEGGAMPQVADIESSVARRRAGPANDPMAGSRTPEETHMYIGGGILGTILLIVLIVYFVRRI